MPTLSLVTQIKLIRHDLSGNTYDVTITVDTLDIQTAFIAGQAARDALNWAGDFNRTARDAWFVFEYGQVLKEDQHV